MWYEVVPIVHEKEPRVDTAFDELSEAFEQAADLAKGLRCDQDAASWSISVVAHSCDKNDIECHCRMKVQVGEYRGLVVPNEFPPEIDEEFGVVG